VCFVRRQQRDFDAEMGCYVRRGKTGTAIITSSSHHESFEKGSRLRVKNVLPTALLALEETSHRILVCREKSLKLTSLS
jgi:hypothetical protein